MTKNKCVKCGGDIKANYNPQPGDHPSARTLCDACIPQLRGSVKSQQMIVKVSVTNTEAFKGLVGILGRLYDAADDDTKRLIEHEVEILCSGCSEAQAG